MPTNSISNLAFEFGLSGGFIPASVSRLGAPGQDIPAGRLRTRVSPGGTLRRMFQGRFTIALTGGADDAEVKVLLKSLAVSGSPVGGTYSGGGDLDGDTTALASVNDTIGYLFHLRLTDCDAPASAIAASIVAETSGGTALMTIPLLRVPTGTTPLPSESAPWEAFIMAGAGTGGQLPLPATATIASDLWKFTMNNAINASGTLDIVQLAIGS
jgi:hypothetical protein